MADFMNQFSDLIKESLRRGIRDGELREGNIPVKSVVDSLVFELQSRNQLPLIQFGFLPPRPMRYYSQEQTLLAPFSIRLICWCEKGAKPAEGRRRAQEMRSSLMAWLNSDWPFGGGSVPRENVSIQLDDSDFSTPYAIGAGVTISGELLARA